MPPDSKILAQKIQENLKKLADTSNNRNPKVKNDIFLLKKSKIPSILIECGFLSNPQEEQQLNDKTYDKSGLIYGMGHAVYTLSDPRAVLLKQQAKRLCEEKGKMDIFNLYDTIERLSPAAFAEVKGIEKVMCANVDLYSGLIYRLLNIPQDMFTPIFAIARTAGWCAHRIEEIVSGGKIIRPAYKTVFKKGRQYIDISQR